MAETPVGDDPLCIGRDAHDPHPTCAAVAYPSAYPSPKGGGGQPCVFVFKTSGGQKITARYDDVQGHAVWEPITLDGQGPPC